MPLRMPPTCSILLVLIVAAPAGAVSPGEAVRQGNALYDAAAQVLPEAAVVHFNLGNALFKQQRFDAAVEHYGRALATAAPGANGLQARLTFNLGNVAYQRALQALPDARQAISYLKSAMTYYRDSLEVDPPLGDARYNLELAHTLLRQLQRQQARSSEASHSEHNWPPDPQQANSPAERQHAVQPGGEPLPQDDSGPAGVDRSRSAPRKARALESEEAAHLLRGIRERAREADRQRQAWRRAGGLGEPVDRDW